MANDDYHGSGMSEAEIAEMRRKTASAAHRADTPPPPGFVEITDDNSDREADEEEVAEIAWEGGVLSIVTKSSIEPTGIKFEPGDVLPWKAGTAIDGGPLTIPLLNLALSMIEAEVRDSHLASSEAWQLSAAWNIAVEAVARIALPIDTRHDNLISTMRGAIARSPTLKVLRAAEEKARATTGAGDTPSPFYYFTPFSLGDPKALPRREFIYGGHYLRRALSGTVAPGGYAKSTLSLVEAVAMVTGRDLLGHMPSRCFRVLVWNGEETIEEMSRRVHGICLRYGISQADLGDRLTLVSGRDAGLGIALTRATKNKVEIAETVVELLTRAIKLSAADVVILDPLVSVHDAPENDNTAMQVVVTALRRIADGANCAIELVHHTRKAGEGRITSDDARGGSALVSGARSVRTLNRMTRDEAANWRVPDHERNLHVQIGGADKSNYQPPGAATWFRLESIGLGNQAASGSLRTTSVFRCHGARRPLQRSISSWCVLA